MWVDFFKSNYFLLHQVGEVWFVVTSLSLTALKLTAIFVGAEYVPRLDHAHSYFIRFHRQADVAQSSLISCVGEQICKCTRLSLTDSHVHWQ